MRGGRPGPGQGCGAGAAPGVPELGGAGRARPLAISRFCTRRGTGSNARLWTKRIRSVQGLANSPAHALTPTRAPGAVCPTPPPPFPPGGRRPGAPCSGRWRGWSRPCASRARAARSSPGCLVASPDASIFPARFLQTPPPRPPFFSPCPARSSPGASPGGVPSRAAGGGSAGRGSGDRGREGASSGPPLRAPAPPCRLGRVAKPCPATRGPPGDISAPRPQRQRDPADPAFRGTRGTMARLAGPVRTRPRPSAGRARAGAAPPDFGAPRFESGHVQGWRNTFQVRA